MPNNANARTLRFFTHGLGRDLTLMLAFKAPESNKLYKDEFPLCWKVITLQGTGNSQATVTYTAYTAFFTPEVDEGNLVTATNSQNCGTGQRVSLDTNQNGLKVVSGPSTGDAKFLECVNNTASAADIGVGFTDKNGDNLDPALLWTKVAKGATLKAKFTPVLLVYGTSDYQETQILRGEIEYPLLWSQDLEELAPQSKIKVTFDNQTELPILEVVD